MKKALLTLVTTVLMSGTAFAQAPRGILAADTNSDGSVSRAEYIAMNIARFARMDANHDNRLSIEERIPERAPNNLPALDPNAPIRPGDVDADRDHCVSREEFFFNIALIFSRFDANDDDAVSADEIAPVLSFQER